MKKNKLLIILSILAAVLVFGAIFAICGHLFADETYTVRIDYVIDGADKPFKIFTEEYAPGSTANIIAPVLDGYQPRQASFVAIVNSDYVVTVVYDCTHVAGVDKAMIISYPTETDDGVMEYTCETCGEFIHTTFTKLSRTMIFGGEAFRAYLVSSESTGYNVAKTSKAITIKRDAIPEWSIFFTDDLKLWRGSSTIKDEVTVTVEFDEAVWGENGVSFSRVKTIPYDSLYAVRLAISNTIALQFESTTFDVVSEEWLNPDMCPLVTSPIKVTLTYDWRI